MFSVSSRVPVTSSLSEDSHATAISAGNAISRLSPLAVGDASRASCTMLTSSPHASPRLSTNLPTASLHSASSRDQSTSLSAFEVVSPEQTQGQDSAVVQRFDVSLLPHEGKWRKGRCWGGERGRKGEALVGVA